MPKNKREFDYTPRDDKFIKLLSRLVTLLEYSLVIDLAEKGMPQQDIRKILGIDMRRITKLLKFVKKSK